MCRRRPNKIRPPPKQKITSANSGEAIRRVVIGRSEAGQATLQMEWWRGPEKKYRKSPFGGRHRIFPWGRRTLCRRRLRAWCSVSPIDSA